jgi:hypothetical protein
MREFSDLELELAARVGALRRGCEQALALLENPDAEAADANRVIKLLETILGGEA